LRIKEQETRLTLQEHDDDDYDDDNNNNNNDDDYEHFGMENLQNIILYQLRS
jgi:hypothetical protein